MPLARFSQGSPYGRGWRLIKLLGRKRVKISCSTLIFPWQSPLDMGVALYPERNELLPVISLACLWIGSSQDSYLLLNKSQISPSQQSWLGKLNDL
jgi:hypothetical protein